MEKTNPKVFAGYKPGSPQSFEIEPMCEDKTAEDGTVKRECVEHADTPDKLAVMFDELRDTLYKHGFQVKVFGSNENMFKSLIKHYSIEFLEERVTEKKNLQGGRDTYS